jgi:hypothetical protein
MGNDVIQQQLSSLGYESVIYEADPQYPGGFVSFKFIVPLGRFRGKEIEVAVNAPQFPMIPPSGPYIKPHILPLNPSGSLHPFDCIHDRKVPTPDYQYWSRPFNNWTDSNQDMKTYIAFLRTLFDFE